MAIQYVYDDNGYLVAVVSSPISHPNSTLLPPTYYPGFTPKFQNGAWVSPSTLPVLTPMQFYLAFAPAERVAIKGSSDANVKEFWATYELAAQTGTEIDPNLKSVQEGLEYLAIPTTATPPGPGILASARIQQILQGIPQ